jgi:DNA-binding transcriptional LysR family regulator
MINANVPRPDPSRRDAEAARDAPPGLPQDPRVERRFLGLDDMVVALPVDHLQAGRGPVHMQALADQTWVEDNDGSAALLRQHAARAGASARIDLTAADLAGKLALVATGHAIALIPGVLTGALRTGVTTTPCPPLRSAPARRPRHSVHLGPPHPHRSSADWTAAAPGTVRSA